MDMEFKEEDFISVTDDVPSNCNDCIVKFKDGTIGVSYYGGGGSNLWAVGIGLPCNKEVVSWINTGGCDSVKNYNADWKNKIIKE